MRPLLRRGGSPRLLGYRRIHGASQGERGQCGILCWLILESHQPKRRKLVPPIRQSTPHQWVRSLGTFPNAGREPQWCLVLLEIQIQAPPRGADQWVPGAGGVRLYYASQPQDPYRTRVQPRARLRCAQSHPLFPSLVSAVRPLLLIGEGTPSTLPGLPLTPPGL